MDIESLKMQKNEQNQDVSIRDLNLKDQNRKTLIAKEKQYINHLTGEVLSSESYSIQVKTQDEFVKLFVENIDSSKTIDENIKISIKKLHESFFFIEER